MNIEVDSSADCFSEEQIIIDSPAKTVYNIISDINSWPAWQSSVSKAQLDGPAEAGVNFKWKSGGLNISSRLHTVNAYSEIGWTGKIWWIKAVHNWYLSEENNKTKVIVRESLKGTGSSFMKKSLNEGMKKNLIELKSRAEKV